MEAKGHRLQSVSQKADGKLEAKDLDELVARAHNLLFVAPYEGHRHPFEEEKEEVEGIIGTLAEVARQGMQAGSVGVMPASELAQLAKKIRENDNNPTYWNGDIARALWENRHALVAAAERVPEVEAALKELRDASVEEAVGGGRWAAAMQQADELLAGADKLAGIAPEDPEAGL
jgi:hypothetical protein